MDTCIGYYGHMYQLLRTPESMTMDNWIRFHRHVSVTIETWISYHGQLNQLPWTHVSVTIDTWISYHGHLSQLPCTPETISMDKTYLFSISIKLISQHSPWPFSAILSWFKCFGRLLWIFFACLIFHDLLCLWAAWLCTFLFLFFLTVLYTWVSIVTPINLFWITQGKDVGFVFVKAFHF